MLPHVIYILWLAQQVGRDRVSSTWQGYWATENLGDWPETTSWWEGTHLQLCTRTVSRCVHTSWPVWISCLFCKRNDKLPRFFYFQISSQLKKTIGNGKTNKHTQVQKFLAALQFMGLLFLFPWWEYCIDMGIQALSDSDAWLCEAVMGIPGLRSLYSRGRKAESSWMSIYFLN